jgi:hypothetical protein
VGSWHLLLSPGGTSGCLLPRMGLSAVLLGCLPKAWNTDELILQPQLHFQESSSFFNYQEPSNNRLLRNCYSQ